MNLHFRIYQIKNSWYNDYGFENILFTNGGVFMDEEKNIVNGQDVQQQADSAVSSNEPDEQQNVDNAVSSNEPDEQQQVDNAVDVNEQDEQQNVVQTGKNESKKESKKRRTAEEIAADKLAREKQLIKDAEEARANIVDYEKQIAALLEQKKEAEKILKNGRNASRTHGGMIIFGDLVNVLGFKDKEKACYTSSDYEDLRKMMISKVKALMKLEEKK